MKKYLIITTVLASLLAGCSKDSVQAPPEVTGKLTIEFSSAGLAFAAADSAVIIWRNSADEFVKQQQLQKASDKFSTDISNINPGSYHIEIIIYSASAADAKTYRFVNKKIIDIIPQHPSIVLPSPKNDFSDEWLKRVEVEDAAKHATVILPMDPRDTYYEVQLKESKWKSFGIQREALYNNVLVGLQAKNKDITGVLAFVDYEAFEGFAAEMSHKQWTKANFSIYLEDSNGEHLFIDHFFFK